MHTPSACSYTSTASQRLTHLCYGFISFPYLGARSVVLLIAFCDVAVASELQLEGGAVARRINVVLCSSVLG